MRVLIYDTHGFEKPHLDSANQGRLELTYLTARLSPETAPLARGFNAVSSFVNDQVDRPCLEILQRAGVRLIAARSAGVNHIDCRAAEQLGVAVTRVPEYSPHAVAEFALALLLTLNRKTHRAFNRVRELNFSLDDLVGWDIHGKTIGVVGTGKIGAVFATLLSGFGCELLLVDQKQNPDLTRLPRSRYVDLPTLCKRSDAISLHVPLTPETRHLMNEQAFQWMKPTAVLINTGRGGLIDTDALVRALKAKRLGGAALDVYEEEENVFFHDLSSEGLDDDRLARLITFPNVLVTSHQAFLTQEALRNIAQTTMESLTALEKGAPLTHSVTPK